MPEAMADGAKYLAVNADDFGFTRDVNAGIVEAHLHGILTSTTLMANGGQFNDAVQLANVIGGPAEISAVRRYTSRSGIAVKHSKH